MTTPPVFNHKSMLRHGTMPVSRVTPFTYRDGSTYLEILNSIIKYVNSDLFEQLDQTLKDQALWLADEVQKIVDGQDQYTEQIDQMIVNFFADVDASLQGLNDYSMSNLIANDESLTAQALVVSTANSISDPTSPVNNGVNTLINNAKKIYYVTDYGATGDGITDDTAAIQATLDMCSTSGGTVVVPDGVYNLGTSYAFPVPGGSQFPSYGLQVHSNTTIISEGGKFIENIDYEHRRVTIWLDGSNITIKGLTIENTYNITGGSRPTTIMIGMGNTYNDSLPSKSGSIVIEDCKFIKSWYSVRFISAVGNDNVISNVRINRCESYHDWQLPMSGDRSSGGMMFHSQPPGKVNNISITDCYGEYASTAAEFGLYGVHDAIVSGCTSKISETPGAGIQCENGAERIKIVNNTLIDHINSIWADDSKDVVISGNTIRSSRGLSAKGVHVSKQGFAAVANYNVDNIVISDNVIKGCGVFVTEFSVPIDETFFGTIIIANNVIDADNKNNYGIYTRDVETLQIDGNTVKGMVAYGMDVRHRAESRSIISRNIIRANGSASSVRVTGEIETPPIMSDNQFDATLGAFTGSYGSTFGFNSRMISGSGSPEGVIVARVGDLYVSRANNANNDNLWIKTSNNDLATGWRKIDSVAV